MEIVTFKLSESYRFGSAFFEFLALRKRFFVDTLGWDIPHDDTHEMDQYDNPRASYSLVLKDGVVVGGARIMSTQSRWGSHTYMLRDAVEGKLIDIPPSVLGRRIDTPDIWECTRLVIDDTVRTQAERSTCLSMIVRGLSDIAAREGAKEMVSLSPLSLMRALRQLGFGANRIGEPYLNEGDGRRYAVLSMPLDRPVPPVAPLATHRPQTPQPVHAPAV